MSFHVASACLRRPKPWRIPPLKHRHQPFTTPSFRIARPITPKQPISISTAVSYAAFSRFTVSVLPLAHLERKYQNNNTDISTPQDIEIQKGEPSNLKIIRILDRILDWLDNWLLEPILICKRFFHVLLLFSPIVIALPIIFIGKRYPEEHDERTGTLWWYDLVMNQMELAGPTFIKVIFNPGQSKFRM